MADSGSIRREVRQRIRRPGLNADVAADVNLVVSTGASANSAQRVQITQGRGRTKQSRTSDTTEEEQ